MVYQIDPGIALPAPGSGSLCLDFTNTVEPRDGMAPNPASPYAGRIERREYLSTYAALVAWSARAGTLSAEAAGRLMELAQQHPAAAQAALDRALELRETIYRIFWNIAHRQPPAGDDLSLLLHALADAAPSARIVADGEQLVWQWRADDALDHMLRPVLSDALALLVGGDPDRIKMCPGVPEEPVCAWLFFDASRNRSRHWCSMGDCGSAAKARRQTARRRAVRKGRQ